MLSLGPPYQSFSQAQPANDRLPPFYLPPQQAANGFQFWTPNLKDLPTSTKVKEFGENAPSLEQGALGLNPLPEPPTVLDNKLMNGTENLNRMTGSSNPRAEQLSWLADVATGASSAIPNSAPSSTNNKTFPSGQTMLHTMDCQAPRSSFMVGANPRMYPASSYHSEQFPLIQQQTSSISGTGLSLYYSQAPRTVPYSNFFHTDPQLPYAAGGEYATLPRVPRLYFHTDMYQSNPSLQIAHNQLPHSPGYLPTASSLSPVSLSPTASSPRMPPHAVLLDRSPEELNTTAQDRDKSHPPHYQQDTRRSSYKSPETVKSKTQSLSTDSTSMSYAKEISPMNDSNPWSNSSSRPSYKVPTGKEGSLKHRILRPPSINIIEPPSSSVMDAPLSAPPIRTHTIPSPKLLRHESYSSYCSSANDYSAAHNKSPTHILPSLRHSPPFIIPTSLSASGVNHATDSGSQLKYPPAFMKGSFIQLANSQLKQVEHMTTEDFLECEALSSNLKIDSSTVVSIEKMPTTGSAKLVFSVGKNKVQITVEAPLEHPFFVYKQGWSSCSPERSLLRYRLNCHKLKVGDTCIFLTVKSDANTKNPMAQLPKQVSIVPTKPQTKTKFVNTSESSKTENALISKSSSCSTVNPLERKPFGVGTQDNVNVVKATLRFAAKHKFDAISSSTNVNPKKRKRRWSAPSEVAVENP